MPQLVGQTGKQLLQTDLTNMRSCFERNSSSNKLRQQLNNKAKRKCINNNNNNSLAYIMGRAKHRVRRRLHSPSRRPSSGYNRHSIRACNSSVTLAEVQLRLLLQQNRRYVRPRNRAHQVTTSICLTLHRECAHAYWLLSVRFRNATLIQPQVNSIIHARLKLPLR